MKPTDDGEYLLGRKHFASILLYLLDENETTITELQEIGAGYNTLDRLVNKMAVEGFLEEDIEAKPYHRRLVRLTDSGHALATELSDVEHYARDIKKETSKCPNCNLDLRGSPNFCPNCGFELK